MMDFSKSDAKYLKVKSEIRQKLRAADEKLESLGPKRQTQIEQTQFLIDIAIRFQEIATSAARADYGRTDFVNHDENLRLATATVNRGEAFSNVMAESGHDFDFGDSEDVQAITELDFKVLALDDEKAVPVRLFPDHPDIQDIVQKNTAVGAPRNHDILAWLKSVYRRSRGFELGTFDSSMLTVTMKHQARKWQDLALGYISDVITLVHSFVAKLLQHIVPNPHVRESLSSLLVDGLREKYRSALDQTKFLLKVELEGTPATYNHYFNDTLNKWYVLSRPLLY
jgi:hypothetical protein